MRKFARINNLIFIIASLYAAYMLIPGVLSNFAKEGEIISAQEYEVIEAMGPGKKISFPSPVRTIAIFWATWCAPCKLEMARLKESVSKGKIPSGAIFAINPFEPAENVRSFLKEHSYPFTFIEDKGISKFLNVNRTPTTVFIENKKVKSLSSGLSFVGIWKAEYFL